MSIRIKATDEDLELDKSQEEVNVFVDCEDDFGSTYITITYKQIEDLYKKIKDL